MISDPPRRQITVEFTPAALQQFRCIPTHIREYLVGVIKEQAVHSHQLMIVMGQTCDDTPHIVRAMKAYKFSPGYRILLHHKTWDSIVIDVVARRDENPYGDFR